VSRGFQDVQRSTRFQEGASPFIPAQRSTASISDAARDRVGERADGRLPIGPGFRRGPLYCLAGQNRIGHKSNRTNARAPALNRRHVVR